MQLGFKMKLARPATWRYVLSAPLSESEAPSAPAAFHNAWLRIDAGRDRSAIAVAAGYAWDGCTMAPDWRGTLAASCLHDAICQFADAIAAAWGWPRRRVLRWGDELFRLRMRRDGAPPLICWLYYWAVRLLGPAYRLLERQQF